MNNQNTMQRRTEQNDDQNYSIYEGERTFTQYTPFDAKLSTFNVPLDAGYSPTVDGKYRNRNLQLPLYYPNSWYFSNHIDSPDVNWTDSPTQISTSMVHPQVIKTKNNPLLLDDIKSAALALTSLSLSPVAPLSADDVRRKKDWSPNDCFIFPPANTPTEENDQYINKTVEEHAQSESIGNHVPLESVQSNKQSVIKSTFCEKGNTKHTVHNVHAMTESTDKDVLISTTKKMGETKLKAERDDAVKAKPRSFSHRDYLTPPLPIRLKPRSNSFDAVGRASKYIASLDPYQQYDDNSFVGHHSAPSPRNKMICGRLGSLDDGLGSSSGSADSVEHIPFKRKLSQRTIFRCMWRGCDKELTTLSGIILHVRHSHIGLSNAGEEEFYFDDVNVDSTTTSGISSSEESLNDACSKRKYRKSFTEDTIKDADLKHIKSYCESKEPFTKSDKSEYADKKRHYEETDVNVNQALEASTVESTVANKTLKCSSILDVKRQHSRDIFPKLSVYTVENPTARHLDSPSFNINFTGEQAYSSSRVFSPAKETTTKRRPKGRKKCRKVYGMSNKNLWCTQCRWKKACARFT